MDAEKHSLRDNVNVVILRLIGLLVMLAGMALVVLPFFGIEQSTISVFAFLFAGTGLIVVGFGVLQIYPWGFYLLLGSDIIAIIAFIVNFQTLPLFKSFFILLLLLILGYIILQRDQFQPTETPV